MGLSFLANNEKVLSLAENGICSHKYYKKYLLKKIYDEVKENMFDMSNMSN